MSSDVRVSIIIPVFNGVEFLDEVLTALDTQRTAHTYETIVIDSGSTDSSIDMANMHGANVYHIAKEDFGHGRTRNLGLTLAKGEYVIFITQDAIPVGDQWINTCLKHFERDSMIVCVYGRQIPRAGVNPFIYKDIVLHFEGLSFDGKPRIDHISPSLESWDFYYKNSGVVGFNSNVCSALKREFALRHPFPEVAYAEDQLMGRQIVRYGYKKVYEPEFAVVHSHQYSLGQYLKRYFDEYRGLQDTIHYVDAVQLRSLVQKAIYATYKDMIYLRKIGLIKGIKPNLFYLVWGFLYHLSRRMGAYLGGRHMRLPRQFRRVLSKEGRA